MGSEQPRQKEEEIILTPTASDLRLKPAKSQATATTATDAIAEARPSKCEPSNERPLIMRTPSMLALLAKSTGSESLSPLHETQNPFLPHYPDEEESDGTPVYHIRSGKLSEVIRTIKQSGYTHKDFRKPQPKAEKSTQS